MKSKGIHFLCGWGLLVCALTISLPVADAQTNSWISGNGKWEAGTNWSLGGPPFSSESVFITNANAKTVTIDTNTSASFPGTLTVSNLVLFAPSPSTNTLFLNSAGTGTPLRVFNNFVITNGGLLVITNSGLRVDGVRSNAFLVEGEMRMTAGASVLVSNADDLAGMRVGTNPGGSGTLTIAGGTLTVSAVLRAGGGAGSTGAIWMTSGNVAVASKLGVATSGTGQMTVSNGTVSTMPLIVGELSGSRGTFTLAGGTATVSNVMVIGRLSAATGTVWMTGGQLTVTNATGQTALEVGGGGVGQMAISNGTLRVLEIAAGSRDGGVGTFTMAGGTVTAGAGLFAASTNTAQGAIWITGGQLQVTNEFVDIGFKGSGQLAVSNGTVTATNMIVADFAGSQGLFTMAGGTVTLSGFLNIGQGGTGSALVAGGFLAANQALGNLMIVSNGVSVGFGSAGRMLVTNGLALVNPLVVGNLAGADGTLTVAGGSVSISAANPAVASVMGLGNMAGATGTCWITGGELLITNGGSVAQLQIGSFGVGRMTVSGGVLRANSIFVGSFPGSEGTLTVVGGAVIADRLRLGTNNNTRGTLRITGGTFTVQSGATNALLLGDAPGATGLVQMTGGDIVATNVPTQIGSLGYGQMTISNGTVQIGRTDIGAGTNTFGSLAVAGGNVIIRSNLTVGLAPGSTGVVMISAGKLTVTNAPIGVGNSGTITSGNGVGRMIVSNGTLVASSIVLGNSAGTRCDLILMDGGVISDGGCPSGTNCQIVINSLGFTQTNGSVQACNTPLSLGMTVPSDCTVSGASANDSFQYLYAGFSSVGTFTLAGGVVNVCAQFIVGHQGLDVGSVIATGAVWVIGGQLTMNSDDTIVGNSGVGQMNISNGVVTAAKVTVGNSANPTSFGTLTLAGGTLTMTSLVLPNPHSRFIFTGGCLNALGITNSNGQMLTLGNGVNPITLNLLGGISSLGTGLKISTNATVSGFGTITGNVVNFGLISPSNSLLTFTGGNVTNNGTMRAVGTVIEAYGTVINNGTIDIINGGVTNFHSIFINHGTVLDAHSVRVSNAAISGNDVRIQIPSVTGHTYQLQYTASLTPTNWTNTGVPQPGNGGVLTFTDLGGATNSPARSYRLDCTAP